MKYRVKNFKAMYGADLQNELAKWLESRKHIHVIQTHIWADKSHFATVIYQEVDYVG